MPAALDEEQSQEEQKERRHMSMMTDRFFYEALIADATIVSMVGTQDEDNVYHYRIANPALTYEQEDKWGLPYLIIGLESVANGEGTKDDIGESLVDTDAVTIMAVASTREELATLTTAVRNAIRTAFEGDTISTSSWGFEISDYTFSAGAVTLDPMKICTYQQLKWDVENYRVEEPDEESESE